MAAGKHKVSLEHMAYSTKLTKWLLRAAPGDPDPYGDVGEGSTPRCPVACVSS